MKARARVQTKGADGVVYVWHWASCEECGDHVHVRADGIDPSRVTPGCCSGNGARRSAAFTHAATDIIKRPLLCGTCGYEKKFGAPPAGAEETDMATKAKKSASSKAKGNANGKGGGKQRSLPRKGADGSERVFKRRYHQDLPCLVDPEFQHAKGRELADAFDEQAAIEDERRTVMASFRSRLNHVKERAKELTTVVRQGTQKRSVTCEDYLLPTNEIETVRLDTGKIVERRPARADELQLELGADPTDDGDDEDDTPPEPPFGSPDQAKSGKASPPANANGADLEATP